MVNPKTKMMTNQKNVKRKTKNKVNFQKKKEGIIYATR
jgi:hypothetical protein